MNWRRAPLVLIGILAVAVTSARAAPSDEMSLGNPKAPVTVIEYASLGCPHCGVWARDVFPQFKKRFIDTGRVRFVLREMLNGDPAVAAAGFLTARCAPKDKYFQVVDDLFAAQPRMEREGDDMPALLDVAARAGLTKAQVSACLSDHAALAALETRVEANASDNHVEGTPGSDVARTQVHGRDQPGCPVRPPSCGCSRPPPALWRPWIFTRLRVSGFKSFVDVAEFHIEPGLTGIVGPNGCGKSNLLEAMRWVMGAASAKAMRGEGMDDVIFAGSGSRPSRNHAEVALTIDNSAGDAPAPFGSDPTLEVTRRIDRGEGSTFRVNGRSRCSAKERPDPIRRRPATGMPIPRLLPGAPGIGSPEG